MKPAILSVVRYTSNASVMEIDARHRVDKDVEWRNTHITGGMGHINPYTAAQIDKLYRDCLNHNLSLMGKYIKSGGGGATDDIQQAQIFGWSRRAKETLNGYRKNPKYEVIPVNIVIE